MARSLNRRSGYFNGMGAVALDAHAACIEANDRRARRDAALPCDLYYLCNAQKTPTIQPRTYKGSTMTTVPFPTSAPRTFQWQLQFPAEINWDKIAQVYAGALQPAYQELWLSSARIIQEHALRAWIDASQACFNALVENAARIQQRALADLAAANQKAAAVYAREVVDATVHNVRAVSEAAIDNARDLADAAVRSPTVH
jgi:hypothetical protein